MKIKKYNRHWQQLSSYEIQQTKPSQLFRDSGNVGVSLCSNISTEGKANQFKLDKLVDKVGLGCKEVPNGQHKDDIAHNYKHKVEVFNPHSPTLYCNKVVIQNNITYRTGLERFYEKWGINWRGR
jgi:hypothetical protein